MAAFALVLGFSQCSKKPVMPSYSGPAGGRIIQHVDMSASYGGGDNNSKLEISTGSAANILSLTWTDGDAIKVYYMEGGEEKPATKDDAGLTMTNLSDDKLEAEFAGDIIAPRDASLIFRSGEKPIYTGQTGKLEDFKGNLLCVEGAATCTSEQNASYKVEMTLT